MGAITPSLQGCLRFEPGHPGEGAVRNLASGHHTVSGFSPPLQPGPQVPSTPIPSQPFGSSRPHHNEPHWAERLGELKHAIKQLLDGKCFGNFRLHLLLNLILSSDAHYARDGISCGLPGAPHTSRRQPASRSLFLTLHHP